MLWEPETDAAENEFVASVTDFLAAVEGGNRDSWINEFFGEIYPLDLGDALVISDIYCRALLDKGHGVLRCTECGCLHIQTERSQDQWTCFEPRGSVL
jgi:hypothetical protein